MIPTKIRIGNGRGYVLATDMSPQMLSIAKQRASSLDLQQVIEFMDGDAETISLPASTFDAVLCRWELELIGRYSNRTALHWIIVNRFSLVITQH
jgi:ubiquinone/menaquinone biosynthesis C-methylase UbiE